MKQTVVVTTTIRVPTFLDDVCKNALSHKKENTSFIIIGDKKTPLEAKKFCEELSHKYNLRITYYGIKEQELRLKDYPKLLKLIPYNSGVRKLIGNFIAYLEGFDTFIMLDDDNFVSNNDFFGYHEIVGDEVALDLIQTSSGWYNVYEAVVEKHNIPIYPRSYPWSKRFLTPEAPIRQRAKRKIAVNNGLVLEDPDIDAISRLFWPIRVVAMKPDFEPRFGLQPGTWSSFNNQNTALCRELIPVYFTPSAGGRNSDIWAGYVICRLVEKTEEIVAYGQPLVRQLRNFHNLWVDLEDEVIGDRATDRFVELLRSVQLTQKNYLGLLSELLDGCLSKLAQLKDLREDEYKMISEFFSEYKIWHDLF